MSAWGVLLNGVYLTDGCDDTNLDNPACTPDEDNIIVAGDLSGPPSGLGLPGLRTEDVTYYQRDGAKHFSDWYQPRFITLSGVTVWSDDCPSCDGALSARKKMQILGQAWKRTCCDTELVIFTDCHKYDLATGINVYPDGTFDVDTDGWAGTDGATVARVTTPVHDGAGALEVTWTTGAEQTDTAEGPVYTATPGDRYQVSAWLYAATGDPIPQFGVSDSLGDGLVYADPITADDSWWYSQVDFLVPASGEIMPFITSSEATTAGDLAYIDTVEMKLYAVVDRSVTGPFGIVGRPRVFEYQWEPISGQYARAVLRFDAVDHRMYILDECGTPGYTNCVQIDPGTLLLARCRAGTSADPPEDRVRCYTGGGRCYTSPVTSDDSVEPAEVNVGGTEKVNPTITLTGPLVRPYVENQTTGEWVQLDTTLGEGTSPVSINTEEGTAFDAEGNSLTHLLRGSLFLSMFPGNYEWRLLSAGAQDEDDPGFATLCFRPTIVTA